MEDSKIVLSPLEKAILESYKDFAEGLSDYLGDGFEFVLHSLENLDKSVIKIINGYHTGRKEGAPITDLALSMLDEIEKKSSDSYISYFTKNRKGEPLKATTIAIRGEGGRVIGLMCINFYLNTPLEKILEKIAPAGKISDPSIAETFADNIDELVGKSVKRARDEIYGDVSVSASNKNKEIIALLYRDGVFRLKDSVSLTAHILGISRNTVYLHIRNLGNNSHESA